MNKTKFVSSWVFPLGIVFMRTFPLLTQWLRSKIESNNTTWKTRKEILTYFSKKENILSDTELKEALTYIKKRGLQMIPYRWAERYNPLDIKVYNDGDLKYVMFNNNRLYFRRGSNDAKIKLTYTALLQEQDKRSPHSYMNDKFYIDNGSIVFDLGGVEGIFALSVIDKASRIYIFEADESWIEPLVKTFEPWKDKVIIINKYASNVDSDSTISVDTLLDSEDSGSVFLKLDVEGAESIVLDGAIKTLTSGKFKVKAAICTYHNQEDFDILSKKMKDMEYDISPSNGYMLCYTNWNLTSPYFRKGMIHAHK
ncbi:hypothetical protein D0T53_09765 [Dysgonomonas sp. 216]|uniref:FkbM family methyltransferase n=1 Tax=Dysgonomonas sp. 216 TaxID=2302934 RepID=UPI0013D685C3|nr:FkbM family methyltransferase [Dysgonomonas sp. 216]NDW19198.1 hypothetical protein [Dysgonomonas sp. 216]